MRFLLLSHLVALVVGGPPIVQWDISHCVDEIINPGVGEGSIRKIKEKLIFYKLISYKIQKF